MSGEDEPVGREVAYRLFAAEYDDATLSHTESDDDRAPNYVITPTGARVNRLFVVGTLTEVSRVNEEMVRARVVDPTGAFVVYAGQYQPEALAFLEGAEPPAFVAVTGKARTFEPDDGDRIYTSVRPESIATVDADTRDRWVVTAAERTDDRIGTIAAAATEEARGEDLTALLSDRGVETGLANGIPLALAHYGTTPDYLRAFSDLSTDAVRVIAGDLEEVPAFDIAPSGEGETGVSYADLAREFDEEPAGAAEPAPASDEAETTDEPAEPGAVDASSESTEATEADPAGDLESDDRTEGVESESVEEEPEAEPAPAGSGSELDADEAARDGAVGEGEPDVDPEPAAGAKPGPGTDGEEPEDARPELGSGTDGAATESAAESGTGDTAENGDAAADLEADVEGEAGIYEMDDEEREEIEDEFGAEFTTGTDVSEPGEADIETQDPDELEGEEPDEEPLGDFDSGSEEFADVDEAADAEPESDADTDVESGTGDDGEDGDEPEPTDTEEVADPEAGDADEADPAEGDADDEEVDLEAYAVETMQDLDDGDGADREAVVERVASETGADEDAVESAIEDALMSGQCYEPEDGTLKAI